MERNGESLELAITPNEVIVDKEKVGQIGVQYSSPLEMDPKLSHMVQCKRTT